MVFNEQLVGEGVKIMKIDCHETIVGVLKNNEFHVFSTQQTTEI